MTNLILRGVLVCCVVWLPSPTPVTAAPSPGDDVQRYLDAVVDAGVPGIAVVVTQDNHVLVETGRGKTPQGAIGAHTRFRIESLSKSFTAAAVLQLVERDLVDLERPVSTYLPDFSTADPRSDEITVRQLLNHSSGLTDRTLGFDQYAEGPTTPRDAVALLGESRLSYSPGSSWDYCNPNYWVAARMVEVVSGEPFATYLRTHIFQPLGMHDTEEYDVPARARGVAPSHSYAFGQPIRLDAPAAYAGGAGGVVTTAHDLGTWLRFQRGHHAGKQQESVLGNAMLHEQHRRQSPLREYPVGYGLGWWDGEPADGGVTRISHSGTGPGVSAYAGLFPDGISVGVLVNANQPRADLIANDLYTLATGGPSPDPATGPAPWRDVVMSLVLLIVAAATMRGISRAHHWVHRGNAATRILILAGLLSLALALACIPAVGSRIFGRQATWTVLWHMAPVPTITLALCCAFLVGLAAVRAVAMVSHRQGIRPGPIRRKRRIAS